MRRRPAGGRTEFAQLAFRCEQPASSWARWARRARPNTRWPTIQSLYTSWLVSEILAKSLSSNELILLKICLLKVYSAVSPAFCLLWRDPNSKLIKFPHCCCCPSRPKRTRLDGPPAGCNTSATIDSFILRPRSIESFKSIMFVVGKRVVCWCWCSCSYLCSRSQGARLWASGAKAFAGPSGRPLAMNNINNNNRRRGRQQ